MDIKVDLKIFIFVILFYFTRQVEIYVLLMIFAVLHELAHMLAGVLLGYKVKSISIMPLGLSLSFGVKPKEFNKRVKKGSLINIKRIVIASAGPIVNFFIGGIFFAFPINFNIIETSHIIYANLLIGIFNLIPIYPLDGGRILKEVLHIFCGLKKAIIKTNIISNASTVLLTAISSIIILFYHNIAILFMVIYLWYLTLTQNKIYNSKIKIYKAIDTYEFLKGTS